MKIVRIRIKNFRCIREAELFPGKHSVFLGPNNVGKTAILEAINLVLNPETIRRPGAIDENDFFERRYLPTPEAESAEASADSDAQPSDESATAQEDHHESPREKTSLVIRHPQ